MIDALKRASAGSIVAIMPYFGYARQDRKVKPRTPISAKLVADLVSAAGASRVLSAICTRADPGLLQHPVRSLVRVAGAHREARARGAVRREHGRRVTGCRRRRRARIYSKALRCGLAIIDKRRDKPNVSRAEPHR